MSNKFKIKPKKDCCGLCYHRRRIVNHQIVNNMTLQELRQRQAWTLHQKVDHTLGVIDQFVSRMDGKVYLAFSGGKDSTVLMHLCEMIKPDIQCVFVNTGCESPSILQFVRKKKEEGHNIITIRPKMTPRDVWAKYGFPLVGKETAERIHAIRTNPDSVKSKKALGDIDPDSMFVLSRKWKYLLVTKYETSSLCCRVLKKGPSHRFARESGLAPIVGTMASESLLREKTYIRRGGCNVFNNNALSLPLSIWNDADIWNFIHERNIEIADIYSNGASRTGCVACGFGCQFKDDTRLELLHRLYPKYYNMVMNFTNNGVTYRQALREMLAVNGLFLPDEDPQLTLPFQ